MKNLEIGTVKYFDGSNDRRFGFLISDRKEDKVFFHANQEWEIEIGDYGSDPAWTKHRQRHQRSSIHPREGDKIVFERIDTQKGSSAAKWARYDLSGHRFGRLGQIIWMSVVMDVLIVTLKRVEFPADSLFGTLEDRVHRLLEVGNFSSEFVNDFHPHSFVSSLRKDETDEQRTIRFGLGVEFDRQKFTELSVGSGIVEDIKFDDLDHARHARAWGLPATASLDDLLQAYDDYMFEVIAG